MRVCVCIAIRLLSDVACCSYLNSCRLSGTIPSSLGRLPLLKVLNLSLNQLTGTIPTELGQLEQLLEMYVARHSLVG
jgi:Leucine-rich repeat (LRR) protein